MVTESASSLEAEIRRAGASIKKRSKRLRDFELAKTPRRPLRACRRSDHPRQTACPAEGSLRSPLEPRHRRRSARPAARPSRRSAVIGRIGRQRLERPPPSPQRVKHFLKPERAFGVADRDQPAVRSRFISRKPSAPSGPRALASISSGTASQKRFMALVSATYPIRPSSSFTPLSSPSTCFFSAT